MSDPAQPVPSAEVSSAPSIFQAEFNGFVSFVVPLGFDFAKGLLIFLTLLGYAWVLQFGQRFHLEAAYIDAFGKAHFWMSFSAFVILGIAFVFRLIFSIIRGGRA